MAAYGAAVSLLNTLSKLKSKHNFPQMEELHKGVDSLKRFLVENREVQTEFETQIRDAIYEAQDIIDSHMWSTHFLSPSEAEISSESFHEDLERVKQKINSIAEMTTEEFNHQTLDRKISASVWRDSDEIDFRKKYPVVGRDNDINELKDRLMKGSDHLQVVPVVGVAGMGKTALAHCLLEDPWIKNHFDAIGWVKVSINYNKHDKLLDLLASLRKSRIGIHEEADNQLFEYQYNWSDEIRQKTNEQLMKHIYNSLKHKRYIILLDDIRDVESWNDLKELFPDYYNGSRILLTTRDVDVAPAHPYLLDCLSDKDTLTLLEEIVFNGETCPTHLAIIAKDIALSCVGLPHAVVIVGNLLSCANTTAEYWEIVLSSIVTCENYVDLMETLVSLTYSHLPQQLKVCLLHMAIFPYNYAIPMIKITIQWIVEGFMEAIRDIGNMLHIAGNSLKELCRRGFLVLCLKANNMMNASLRIAEEVFHDFLVRKAKEEKFFLVINKDASYGFRQGNTTYNQQRRLCIQQNIRHFIKDLSTCNLNLSVRSLIYSGPEYQYRLGAWSEEFKLLEVLDALKIGFYTFPPEILKLIQLKYLAFSYNGQLPTKLGNLQNLQVLIVSDYLNLKCCGVPSYLPAEIWNLKELMHLQVVGSDLPEPPSGTNLENLFQLLDVSARSCTRNIFKRIPNLATLEVRIEPSPKVETLSFFSYLYILEGLHFFKCIVIYPDIGSQVFPSSFPFFPSTLAYLTLSGCGFPWKYMRAIAALPKLEYLKLQSYAFQGPEWEVKTDEFPKLQCLHLEDMDFEKWTFNSSTRSCFSILKYPISRLFNSSTGSSFPVLKYLMIRHCYKLGHIPSVFADSSTLELLEVVDCSTSAMNSALEIEEEIRKRGNHSTQFDIFSSQDY